VACGQNRQVGVVLPRAAHCAMGSDSGIERDRRNTSRCGVRGVAQGAESR